MTASVAWRLWFMEKEFDLVPALKAGLSAARVLRESGHGMVGDLGQDGAEVELRIEAFDSCPSEFLLDFYSRIPAQIAKQLPVGGRQLYQKAGRLTVKPSDCLSA